MANPQTENGYTTVANEILEAICKVKLNGTQYSIVMVVWRSTYGWSKKEHEISETFLSNATGINKKQISRELKVLIDKKMIVVIDDSIKNKGRLISFNKNHEEWELISRVVTKKRGSEKVGTGGSEKVGTGGSELEGQKNNIKNNIKNNKQDYKSLYDYYLTLGLMKHRNYTDAMRDAIKKAMKECKYTIDDCKTLLDRHKLVVDITKKDEYKVPARGLAEFFGQKVYNAKHLICSEYEEGGKKYEQYLKNADAKEDKDNYTKKGAWQGWKSNIN